MKSLIALNLRKKLKQAELASFAQNVQARMAGNPKFAEIRDLVETDLKVATEVYGNALQAAADGGRSKTAEKRSAAFDLMDVLETIASRVNIIAKGDERVALDAGFRLRKIPKRREIDLEPITDLQLRCLAPGEVEVRYKPTPYAVVYALEWRREDESDWNNGCYPTATRWLLRDLPSRTEVLVRVFAIGRLERVSPWCSPVQVFVL